MQPLFGGYERVLFTKGGFALRGFLLLAKTVAQKHQQRVTYTSFCSFCGPSVIGCLSLNCNSFANSTVRNVPTSSCSGAKSDPLVRSTSM
eukprot:4808906-Amphidinium_carterae.1